MVRVVPIHIIGAASGFGARDPGCAEGPDTLRDSGVVSKLQAQGIDLFWRTILYPGNAKPILRIIQEFNEQLALEVASVAASKILPLVIGGDHSCAIGTWSGTFLAIRQHGPLGLIWIDAHMDSHTPRTSPSGAIHGMPLAVLLGQGLPELVNIATPKAKLLPRHPSKRPESGLRIWLTVRPELVEGRLCRRENGADSRPSTGSGRTASSSPGSVNWKMKDAATPSSLPDRDTQLRGR